MSTVKSTMMSTSKRETLRLVPQGLRLAPSQVWGGIRLVPVLRDDVRGDLRFTRRAYDEDLTIVPGKGGAGRGGPHYVAYVPHGLVMDWDDKGAQVAVGTQLDASEGRAFKKGPFSVRVLHRMVKREDKRRLRLLPLHLAMEGFLLMHFEGPSVAWTEYSHQALSQGLGMRGERSVPGWASAAFDEALRVFELHEQQVGVLVFQADQLLSASIVSHPEDYRALHRSLVEDFYGELLLQYGFLGDVLPLGLPIDERHVSSLNDLRAAVTRMRGQWAGFLGDMAGGILGTEVFATPVYQAGPFRMQRFITALDPSQENHLGECVLREDGTLEYLKTYRLSAAQARRAYLLQQLAHCDWNLERTATQLKTKQDELVTRLVNAGFGYLLAEHVLREARRRHRS